MTEIKLRASYLISASLFNPVRVKPSQRSGGRQRTLLSVFGPEPSFAVPSHENAGPTWLSHGRVYLAFLKPSKSSWGEEEEEEKKKVF